MYVYVFHLDPIQIYLGACFFTQKNACGSREDLTKLINTSKKDVTHRNT